MMDALPHVSFDRAATPKAAKQALGGDISRYPMIFLDYDLSCTGGHGLWTSKMVADSDYKGLVVVHSANHWGSEQMLRTLGKAGVSSTYAPVTAFPKCVDLWKDAVALVERGGEVVGNPPLFVTVNKAHAPLVLELSRLSEGKRAKRGKEEAWHTKREAESSPSVHESLRQSAIDAHFAPHEMSQKTFNAQWGTSHRLHSIRAGDSVMHHGQGVAKTVYPVHASAWEDLKKKWQDTGVPLEEQRESAKSVEPGYGVLGSHKKDRNHFIPSRTIDEVHERISKDTGRNFSEYGGLTNRKYTTQPSGSAAHEAAVLDAHRRGEFIPEHNRKAYPHVFTLAAGGDGPADKDTKAAYRTHSERAEWVKNKYR